ncbi:MAG: GNAT family N-acetyltransferase [Chloroflexaceae bacterium]|jgi:GNAT superfamily N-acetyltransferase|nr:GNAT family N-acetyltransferase [Chloroflexaceae bacterium]
MNTTITLVQPDTAEFAALLAVAEQLNQMKYVLLHPTHVNESLVLGAWNGTECVGFLHLFVQVLGREEGRPPVLNSTGEPLREGYVEAFGVRPGERRQGLGQQLQEHAIALCRQRGCYQIRSRSPVYAYENYGLKLKMGYTLHPSNENDSYYFIKKL